MKNSFHKALPAYFFTSAGIFFLTFLIYMSQISEWNTPVILLVAGALIFYPVALAAAIVLTALAVWAASCKLKEKLRYTITWCFAGVMNFIIHSMLLFDAGLYLRYDYHINPHIINIFTTPGGFEAMGMRPNEIFLLAGGLVVLLTFHAALVIAFVRFPALSFAGSWRLTTSWRSWRRYAALAAVAGAAFLLSFTVYSYEHFVMHPPALLAARAIPLYISGTSSSLYKALGLKKPDRNAVQLHLAANRHLANYPANPIRRNESKKRHFNVIWLTCESFANRMFTPQIMPQTTAFAKKAVVFRKHYSGGNVTRQGMFSQFYALPGNYWHAFLAARRGPLFIDWMIEDGYLMDCITSSKFTYPEFDQTIFFKVPSQFMHSDFSGRSFERDRRNIRRLMEGIERNAASGKPFFSFMFFESPHHPYDFPDEAILFKDYIDPFNAAKVTPADSQAIIKRAANACFHLDMLLGKVFALLEKKDLLKNTIVVVAGDHGEEYFEKGYLGHSSKFNEEQTRTPLILYHPGITPGEYRNMSSHLDIVPMLAKFFGVENPPEDYSCGLDLLNPASIRRYSLIANWDELFFAGEKYKSLIPLDPLSFARQVITDTNDAPLDAVEEFYAAHNADLAKIQQDISRFTASDEELNDSGKANIELIFSLIALLILIAGTAAGWKYQRHKRKSVDTALKKD